jgi:hypothetical protein
MSTTPPNDIGSYDEEDMQLRASPEFWRMIQERRRGPTVAA